MLRYTLNLFENVANFEVCGGLRESTLTDIVDLLEVKDPMEDALRFVEGLVGDLLALFVQMIIELLQVNERDFRRLLDLPHDLLSEVVEVLLGVHELLEIHHRVEVSDDKELVLAAGHVDIHLVH